MCPDLRDKRQDNREEPVSILLLSEVFFILVVFGRVCSCTKDEMISFSREDEAMTASKISSWERFPSCFIVSEIYCLWRSI